MKNSRFVIAKNPRKSFLYFFLSTLIGTEGKIAWLEILFKIISEIQVIAILLYFPFQVMDNKTTDTFGYFTQKISQYFCFYDLFDFTTPSWLNNVIYTGSSLCLLCLVTPAILIIIYHYRRKQLNLAILKIWNSFGTIHYSFVFLLGYQYFLSLINQLGNDSFTLYDMEQNLSFTLNPIIRLLPHIVLAPLFCRFLYIPLESEYISSRRTTIPESLLLLFKIIDVPLSIFYSNISVQRWIRLVIMSVIFVSNANIHISHIPYFHYWPMKLSTSFSFIHVALTISNIIMVLLSATRDVQSFSSVYLSIILSIFAIKAADLALKKIIKNSFTEVIEIKSKKDFYRKMFALNFILSKGTKREKNDDNNKEHQYDFFLYGVISQHKKRCTKQVCGCQTISQNIHIQRIYTLQMESQLERNFRFELKKELYRESLKKMPLDFELRIGFAYFLFQTKTHSDGSSISLIHALGSIHKNIEMKVISGMLLESIEKKIEKDNDHSMNIKDVVDYQFLSSELKAKIEVNSAYLLRFWELYKSSDPHVTQLYSISVKIEKESKKIESVWGQIIRKYSKLAHQDYLFYGLYQSLVRNAPDTGNKALLKYFETAKLYDPDGNRDSLVTSQNLHEPDNIFVYITMKKEKLGNVHYITSNVEDILQYNQQEVINKNITILMPHFFQERHNKYLVAHIDKGRISALNKNSALFSRNKNGYVMPVSVYVNIFPYFQEQLLYVGIIRPTRTFDDFLLVLDDGTIDSFSQEVGKKLNLRPRSGKKYHLHDISRDLSKLHKAFLQFIQEDFGKAPSATSISRRSSKTQTYLNQQSNFVPPVETVLDLSRKIESAVIKEEEQQTRKQNFNENPTSTPEDIAKLYELFMTIGTPITFNAPGQKEQDNPSNQITYNTILTERIFQGSHLRVYQLQPLNTDDQPYTMSTVKSPDTNEPATLGTKKTLTKQEEEFSRIAISIPSDEGAHQGQDDNINFRNPFSEDNLVVLSENNETLISPKTLASPKDPLLPLLSATSQEKSTMDYNLLVPGVRRISSSGYVPFIGMRAETRSNTAMHLISRASTEKRKSTRLNPPKVETKVLSDSESSLGDKHENRHKMENKDFGHFLKEKKIIIGEKANDIMDRGSVTSSVQTNKINSKLQNAIYYNKKSLATKILTLMALLFCAVSVILLIILQDVVDHDLTKIVNNVYMLENSYERLFYAVEADRRARRIDFIQRGLAPSQRHVADYVTFNQNALSDVSKNLSYYNSQMRSTIYTIDKSQYPHFYNLIPVRDRLDYTKIRQENTFDLCSELASAGLALYAMRPTKPLPGDVNLDFILNNTLNDLLVESQNIVLILRSDNTLSMEKIQDAMTGMLAAVVTLFAVVFVSFVKTEVDFIKAKAHFIEVFLMIKEHEIDVPLSMVNNFYTSLKETKKETSLLEKLTEDKQTTKSRLTNIKKLESKTFKAKKANKEGVNRPTFFNIIFTFMFLSAYWSIFSALLGIYVDSKGTIQQYRRRTVNAKVNHFNYGLALAGLYEYVTENGTTQLMNNPISSAWETIYTNLTASLSDIASYANGNTAFHDQIYQLLEGNLCQLQIFADRQCATEALGIPLKGLLAVDAFIITYFRNVKDFFDNSNRTTQAIKATLVLKDLINTEILFEVYSKRGYKQLDKYMLQQFALEMDQFQSYLTNIIIGSAVVLLVVTLTCWFYVKKRMEKERVRYRRMLRTVPVSVFLSNRILKNYLLNNSSQILDSVKNRI